MSDFNELEYWKSQLRTGVHGNDTREFILRELRAAANRKGIVVPGYNTTEFKEFLNK